MTYKNAELPDDDSEDKEEAPLGWATSHSKALLRRKLLSGSITPNMKPKQVFELDYEVHKTWKNKYKSWASSFNRLRNAVQRDQQRSVDDVARFAHDMAIVSSCKSANPPTKPRWYGSEAEKKLKEDVKNGIHKTMKPKSLHKTREEYKMFDLEVFRKQIY